MENENKVPDSAQVPNIPESELKMPEENIPSAANINPKERSPVSPFLVSLLIASLVLLGVVLVWGEQIMEMVMPADTEVALEEDMEMEEDMDLETEIDSLEQELESAEIDDVDSELAAIEAELNAEF